MIRHLRAFMVVGLMTLFFAAVHASAPRAYAATPRYVNPSSGNDTGGTNTCASSASPCKTITHALTEAAAGDTLNLAAGTYSVAANGETLPLNVSMNLTIVGAGAATTTIDGASTHQVMIIGAVTVSLSNVTIKNGNSTGAGGGINNAGTLTVTNSTFFRNHATNFGGGIYNNNGGTVTVTNSTFSSNSAANAGGIFNGGTVTVTNSTFSSNGAINGGGIYNVGTLTVTNSTFSSNSASFLGGGILNDTAGTLTVTNSTFASNSAAAGGGIANGGGTLTVTNSTFSGNSAAGGSGGGILNNGGTVTVTNSTFSSNSASYGGGGIDNGGTLTVTNSTFSGNSATTAGGGIDNGGTATLLNTIVANSTGSGNCNGAITDGGHNLQFGGSVANSCGATIPTGDPVLGALANNGGPTQTMALGAGSAALDKIPNASGCGVSVTTDQRGIARPQPAGGLCDIGAYELAQSAPAPAAPAEVPEADTLLLFGGGLGGLVTWVGWQWRKRRTRWQISLFAVKLLTSEWV